MQTLTRRTTTAEQLRELLDLLEELKLDKAQEIYTERGIGRMIRQPILSALSWRRFEIIRERLAEVVGELEE